MNLGSRKEIQALLLKLLTAFPFLLKYKKENFDEFGTFPFKIIQYETYFNQLAEDYYSRDHIQQGGIDYEGPRNKGLVYNNGKLSLFRIDQNNSTNVTTFSNSPVMNGFISNDNKHYKFILVNNGKEVENNPSFFFSKANFIYLNDKGNDKDKIDRIYRSIPIDSNLSHTVCSEVFTNTGIKCRMVASKNVPSSILPPSEIADKISKYFDEYQDRLLEFIEMIPDGIFDIDRIAEFFDEYLKTKGK
jgi:hypothetical protein